MKIQTKGYIKLHRKFLESHVHQLKGSAFRLFIDLLLLADKEGTVDTSVREITKITNIKCNKDLKRALEELQNAGAIKFSNFPNLKIKLENWNSYQARSNTREKPYTSTREKPYTYVGKNPTESREIPYTPNNRVPVPITKEYKNIFKNSKNVQERKLKMLNFQTPQTDLEKLIRFYLEGTRHPALKKPNNNDLLNLAVQNDIPHFKTILANCDDLEQAKKCVKKYVSEARGAYSMFYLAGMINSIRQEVESRENKRHE